MTRRLLLVALVVFAWTAFGTKVHATHVVRTTADEPEYLLTALSIGEDFSLDVSDEREARRYDPFHDVPIPEQTKRQADGSRISPHDPLLPLLLAAPMRIGGWVAAKFTIAAMAGALAALLLWTMVRRFAISRSVATAAVLAVALSPPMAAYATQVYPELPAALVVVAGVACLTGAMRRSGVTGVVACVIALPWLAIKYAPVAAVLALWLCFILYRRNTRADRVLLGAALGALAVGGITYLAGHQVWYGGWTVYASGDHFVGGEFTAVGNNANPPGRSVRLVGLIVDRYFGLGVWQPLFFATPLALGAALRRRPHHLGLVLTLFAAGWLNATFVALTMQGYWFPGRQVVVIVPMVTILLAWWAEQLRYGLAALAAAAVVGAANFAWIVAEGWNERVTWVNDFFAIRNPVVQVLQLALPDYQRQAGLDWALHVGWSAAIIAAIVAAYRTTRIRVT